MSNLKFPNEVYPSSEGVNVHRFKIFTVPVLVTFPFLANNMARIRIKRELVC